MSLKLSHFIICTKYNNDNRVFMFDRRTNKHYIINSSYACILQEFLNGSNDHDFMNRNAKFFQVLRSANMLIDDSVDPIVPRIRFAKETDQLNTVQLELTKRCNFGCKHCFHGSLDEVATTELTTQEIFRIIEQANDMGVFEFDVTGGEPLLRTDIREILSYIYVNGMRTRLYTNGYLLTPNFITFLREIGIYCVRISLDGICSATHNAIRSDENLDRILYNMREIVSAGINLEVSTVVMKKNLLEIPLIIKEIRKEFNARHFLSAYIPIHDSNLLVTPSEYVNAIKDGLNEYIPIESPKGSTCGIAYDFMYINSRGSAALCPLIQEVTYGETHLENGLALSWESLLASYKGLTCKHKEECTFAGFCGNGCRARALYVNGDINEKDEYICHLHNHLLSAYTKN